MTSRGKRQAAALPFIEVDATTQATHVIVTEQPVAGA